MESCKVDDASVSVVVSNSGSEELEKSGQSKQAKSSGPGCSYVARVGGTKKDPSLMEVRVPCKHPADQPHQNLMDGRLAQSAIPSPSKTPNATIPSPSKTLNATRTRSRSRKPRTRPENESSLKRRLRSRSHFQPRRTTDDRRHRCSKFIRVGGSTRSPSLKEVFVKCDHSPSKPHRKDQRRSRSMPALVPSSQNGGAKWFQRPFFSSAPTGIRPKITIETPSPPEQGKTHEKSKTVAVNVHDGKEETKKENETKDKDKKNENNPTAVNGDKKEPNSKENEDKENENGENDPCAMQ